MSDNNEESKCAPPSNNLRVRNLISPRTGRKVVNQYAIDFGNLHVFQSYDLTVVTIDDEAHTITFGKDWDYSVTTAKYRGQYMRERGFHGVIGRFDTLSAINAGKIRHNGTTYTVKLEESSETESEGEQAVDETPSGTITAVENAYEDAQETFGDSERNPLI